MAAVREGSGGASFAIHQLGARRRLGSGAARLPGWEYLCMRRVEVDEGPRWVVSRVTARVIVEGSQRWRTRAATSISTLGNAPASAD